MRVEIISFAAGGDDEIFVNIELREGESLERRRLLIPSALYVDMRLCRGECSCEHFDALEYESRVHAAYKRAIYILGFGACSERMLASKLIAKGFDRDIARAAVARASACGFLPEVENAKREAERCASRLWGAIRIRAHLGSRGYGKDAIDEAMFALEDDGVDFGENCKRLIDSKCKRLPKDKAELQRLISSVCRYGYSLGEVRSACAEIASRKESIYD